MFTLENIMHGDQQVRRQDINRNEILLFECAYPRYDMFEHLLESLLSNEVKIAYADYYYYYNKKRFKFLVPNNIVKYVSNVFNISRKNAYDIVIANKANPRLKWNNFPGTVRGMLALDAVSLNHEVIIFDAAGVDPMGCMKIYKRVCEIAGTEGKAFIHIETEQKENRMRLFSDPREWLSYALKMNGFDQE